LQKRSKKQQENIKKYNNTKKSTYDGDIQQPNIQLAIYDDKNRSNL